LRLDLMLDRSKDALAVIAPHLDADGLAKTHVVDLQRPVLADFDGAFLRNTAVALGPFHAAVLPHARVTDRVNRPVFQGARLV